jgi:hypothetical protein
LATAVSPQTLIEDSSRVQSVMVTVALLNRPCAKIEVLLSKTLWMFIVGLPYIATMLF